MVGAAGQCRCECDSRWGACVRAVRIPLLILTCLAMSGILIEAYFINRFYHFKVADLVRLSNLTAAVQTHDISLPHAEDLRPEREQPCSPFAYRSDVQALESTVLEWSDIGADVCGFNYTRSWLEVQTEGYYFVFSSVIFDSQEFHHSVQMLDLAYPKLVSLMANTFRREREPAVMPSQSYLSGIFYLSRKAQIKVTVTDSPKIQGHNTFGAFRLR